MPDLSVEETAATQSTSDSEVGPGEEAIVVEGASVDAEGTSVFEGISVVAEETSLVAATSVRVAVVLSFIVGHSCQCSVSEGQYTPLVLGRVVTIADEDDGRVCGIAGHGLPSGGGDGRWMRWNEVERQED